MPLPYPHRKELEHQIAELTFSCDDPVEEAVIYYAGPRCDDYEPLCASCRTWRAFDNMKANSVQFASMLNDLIDIQHNLGEDIDD